MKTVFFIVVLTIVYIYAMIQLEALRMANPNVNPIASISSSQILSSSSSSSSSNYTSSTSSLSTSSSITSIISSSSEVSSSIIIEEKEKVSIYIYGCINKPGEYIVEQEECLDYVIELAGGLNQNADLECIDLYYSFNESTSLYVPPKSTNEKISINSEFITELDKIPGVGEAYANRILQYRYENGDFQRLEDIVNVYGIGETMFEKIKDMIKL